MPVTKLISLFLGICIAFSQSSVAQDLFSRKLIQYDTASSLIELWELTDQTDRRTLLLSPYRPIFVLPVRYTTNINKYPVSENPDLTPPEVYEYGPLEAKFQFSFKVKLINGALFGKGDLWVHYTQQTLWQAYNRSLSFPIRETNFRPGVVLTYPVDFSVLGFNARMAGIGFLHSSNGRALPFSRAWDRVYATIGLERRRWKLVLRPWVRIGKADDDNPEIENFIGRGDVNVSYSSGSHNLLVRAAYPFDFDRLDRGHISVNYIYDVGGHFNLMFQATNGYGETIIDYNHAQTTVGMGVAFLPW
jgi:phospholipase A1